MVELGRWSSLVKDSGLGTEKASEPEIAGSNPARPTCTTASYCVVSRSAVAFEPSHLHFERCQR